VKNRLPRVRELLQRELGAIIARDHAFPGLLVTVNDVDITPDLKHCYVYIGVIGPEQKAERVVEKLNHQHGELQSRMAKRVILKNTPRLHFRLDHSVERGVRITGIMEVIDKQLAESAGPESETGTGADVDADLETEDKDLPEDAKDPSGEPADEDDSDATDDETAGTRPDAFPRRTGPRRSPRHFAQHDDE
jgi:ribosome-binding factor A